MTFLTVYSACYIYYRFLVLYLQWIYRMQLVSPTLKKKKFVSVTYNGSKFQAGIKNI